MRVALYIAVGVLWMAAILFIAGREEYKLRSGKVVLLKTIPVDPRDLFRGDYVILNYEFSRIKYEETDINKDIYVILKQEEPYWKMDYHSFNKPQENTLFIKGRVTKNGIIYGIEKYFVPEGKGWELEKQRNAEKLDVEVAVTPKGEAAIKRLILDGKAIDFSKIKKTEKY